MNKFAVAELLLVLTVSTALGATYDDSFARYKVYPMASAAYSSNPALCVNDNFDNATLIKQYTVQCDVIQEDTCSAFTAVSHSDKAIILSFKGTDKFLQFVSEGVDSLATDPKILFDNAGVNDYFLNGYNVLWSAGMKNDFLSAKNTYPDYELWVTGHSLGGAMASITATVISHLGYMPPEKIKLVTFGQPRVGNNSYVAAVDKLIQYSFRVVHNHDIVPHLPTEGTLGYYHHRSEVWYNNDMSVGSTFEVCTDDDGEGCSNGAVDLNPFEHFTYFTLSTSYAKNGCPRNSTRS